MSNQLQGKIAFVTGASSGIGEATALRFAAEGALVVLCGRRAEPLEQVKQTIINAGGKAEVAVADVSVEAEIVAAIEGVAQRHGRLDILVNNAMAYTWGSVDSMSTEQWHANFQTTVDGTFWGVRTAVRLMKDSGGGSIVNIASICGQFGTAWMTGYSAAKAAVINFSRAVASEGAAYNIRCNVIIPGVVETPAMAGMLSDPKARSNTEKLIPMKRVGRSEELASAILFMASDESSYVTGATLNVDGGRSSDLYTVLE
ncbi:SDR family NAD(P)-dependent oxidoreductase [Pseudomonas sp. TTU2014-080ASC]|uniref:SDR family NAD(P)-dependent oxidoreductase n=1 Tax=Pseudomonas sp. TTU2014-080ASC TaxID=1729724 RepID=UPI0007189FF0|nr:SDR family NAD(P)-dependent oxidoreductase [Pseudomonas sp. TTU2014-080ASC]KRW58450.1 2,5-dichloro-2,5-cyclohexadiene-1,4-diol dehydrogenase [Pseudomonas sp. TTU2014-080ASC]